MFGSEFGNRHAQYENFYAGPSFVVRSHSARYAPWDEFRGVVDGLLKTIQVPGEAGGVAEAAAPVVPAKVARAVASRP
jgi:4-hydroxyphenylacetate 3-monooxygenase